MGRMIRWGGGSWIAGGSVAAGLAMVVGWLLDPLLGLAVGGGALVLLVATRGWVRSRRARMPLEIAPVGVSGRRDGVATVCFRACLGDGRMIRDVRCRVRFRDVEGEEIELRSVFSGARAMVGPWTIAVVAPDESCRERGVFVVDVEGREGDRWWCASRRIPGALVREGRFCPMVERGTRGVRWMPGTWRDVAPGE